MAEKETQQSQIQSPMSDLNIRLNDLEERNRIIRERVLLLGQNLISSKEDIDNEIEIIKKQSNLMQKDLDKLKILSQNIVSEINRFVKKDEILLIERMLKDFQPLEFARIKDVEDLIDRKLNLKKQESIKTEKPINNNLKTEENIER
ncbi:MAG: hypothetical protein Q7S33_05105 [Nanoarchaeota archaeon]|nr:hypothetical protein [Nanoarchaeota archaeon]